jgi:hypothetical protein
MLSSARRTAGSPAQNASAPVRHAIVMHFVIHKFNNFGFRFNLFENENRRAA